MPKFELNFGLGTDRSKLSTLLYSQDSCSRPWVCVCVCVSRCYRNVHSSYCRNEAWFLSSAIVQLFTTKNHIHNSALIII